MAFDDHRMPNSLQPQTWDTPGCPKRPQHTFGQLTLIYTWLVRIALPPGWLTFENVDYKVLHGQGTGKYVEGHISESSLFLVRELPTPVIFTVNLTAFFPCSLCCCDQENEWALPSSIYIYIHINLIKDMYLQMCTCSNWKYEKPKSKLKPPQYLNNKLIINNTWDWQLCLSNSHQSWERLFSWKKKKKLAKRSDCCAAKRKLFFIKFIPCKSLR